MTITYPLIKSLGIQQDAIALNAYQLRVLGIVWPPKHGWVKSLLGVEISDDALTLLEDLRGLRTKAQRNSILAKHGLTPVQLFSRPMRPL